MNDLNIHRVLFIREVFLATTAKLRNEHLSSPNKVDALRGGVSQTGYIENEPERQIVYELGAPRFQFKFVRLGGLIVDIIQKPGHPLNYFIDDATGVIAISPSPNIKFPSLARDARVGSTIQVMGLVCEGDSNSIEVGSRWIMFHGAQVDLEDSLMDLAREAQILKLYKDHYFSEWFPVASASHNPNQLIEYPRRQTPYIRGYINRARMTYHPPNQEQRRTNQAFSPSLFSQPPRLHPTTPMKVRDGKANKFNYSPQHATPSRLGQRPSLTKKFKTPMKQSVSNLNDCDSRHPPQTKPTDISVENRPEYLWGDDDTHIQSMQEDTEAELWGNDDMDFLFEAVTNMSDDLSNNVFSALSNAGSMTLTDLVQLFPVIPVEDLKKAITSLALGGMVHESSNGRIFVI